MVAGRHMWLPGVCMVAGGHAWLWQGVHGCWGACMVVEGCVVAGGMHGCWGACVVTGGGMHGCGRACMVVGGVHGCWGACIGYDEIRSMSGRYVSYWKAFLLLLVCVSGEFLIEKCISYTRRKMIQDIKRILILVLIIFL